jgi:predicted unusual protein kinase regulating ubiquinone biosynthesis (AarF/ABC1/UbiB family)
MGNHCASLLGKQKMTKQTDDCIPSFSFGVKDMIPIRKQPVNQIYYIDRRPLACGSYGQVFKAIHRETQVVRAIKKI